MKRSLRVSVLLLTLVGLVALLLVRDEQQPPLRVLSRADTEAGDARVLTASPDASSMFPSVDVEDAPVALEVPAHESSAAERELLIVRVSHANGAPATGARVGLLSDELIFVNEGVLDASGAWECRGRDAPSVVIVVGVTPEPVRFDLDPGVGLHELSLPEGPVISGRVLIDGEPADEPFPLVARSAEPASHEWHASDSLLAISGGGLTVPRLHSDLAGFIGDPLRFGFYTAADGSFTISGFPKGERVRFDGPAQWARPAWPNAAIAPAQNVEVHLDSPTARLCGRVVDELGEPVPNASLRVRQIHTWRSWELDDEAIYRLTEGSWERERIEGRAEADGRFCLTPGLNPQIPWVPPGKEAESARHSDRIEVLARGPGDLRARIEVVDPVGEQELGDLVLRPTPHHMLNVTNERGRRFPDVLVRIDHAEEDLAFVHRTDGAGRALIEAEDVGSGTLTIVAKGYDTARIVLPALPAPDPIAVQLRLAASLTVEVSLPPAFVQGNFDWLLELQASPPVFNDGLLPDAPLANREVLAGPSGLRVWNMNRRFLVEESTPGRVILGTSRQTLTVEGVRPHNPVTPRLFLRHGPGLAYRDEGLLVWTGEPIWVEPGEQRRVHVDLSQLELPR